MPADVAIDGVLVDFRPREVLVDPVSYKQIPLGAIVLASASGFSDEVRLRLDLFRQGLSLALNNSLVHDRLQRLAALDPLTAVYNRRFGMSRLHEEFGRAVRANIAARRADVRHRSLQAGERHLRAPGRRSDPRADGARREAPSCAKAT